MFCPHCGKENAAPFAFCPACGKPLPSTHGATTPTAPPSAPPATPVRIVPGQAYPGPAAPGPYSPVPPRRKSPVGIILAVVGFLVALLSVGIYFVSQMSFENPDQRVSRLMREAAGLQPVHEHGFARDREFDNTFREQFRHLLQLNKDYSTAEARLDMSAIDKLNSPESFADSATGSLILKQLHAAYDLDASQEQNVKEVMGNLRRAIENSGWSASTRDEALRGFNQGVAQQAPIRERLITTEKAWMDSLGDIYGYAGQNGPQFIVRDGKLLIADDTVLTAFNSKMRSQEARRKEFLNAKKEFDEFQGNLFRKMGLSPHDVGIH